MTGFYVIVTFVMTELTFLIIFTKSFIVDVWRDLEYAADLLCLWTVRRS